MQYRGMTVSRSRWNFLWDVHILFWGLCKSKLKPPKGEFFILSFLTFKWSAFWPYRSSNPNSCTIWSYAGHLRKVVQHKDTFCAQKWQVDWLTSLCLMCAFGLCECSYFRADDSPPINRPRSTSSRSVEDVSSDPHVTNGSNRLSADLDNYAQVRL